MKALEEPGSTVTTKEPMNEEYTYRNVKLEIPKKWKPKVIPLINFVLDNGGIVLGVKLKFYGLRFYYEPPKNHDEDIWDSFYEMVRLLQLRSGHWMTW